MNLSDAELSELNDFLNSSDNLPNTIEAINVKLRDHFQQDNSVIDPVVEQIVQADSSAPDAVVTTEQGAPATDATAPVEDMTASVADLSTPTA